MEIQKTSGIVLKSKSTGEADVACSILTKDYGKRHFLFKGLRKSRKRPLSAKEPGTSISMVYYFNPEKKISIINECSILDAYPAIQKDLERIYHLSFMLESVDKTSGEGNGDIKLYRLLEGAIKALAATGNHPHLSAFFLLHLLKIHGMLPDQGRCSACSREINEEFFLTTLDLQRLCPVCTRTRMLDTAASRGFVVLLNSGMSNFISESLSRRFSTIDMSQYAAKDCLSLITAMVRFIEQYFQVKINSFEFIDSCR